MSELYPSDAALNALSGTSDGEQEVLYLPIGQSPYHTSFYKMQRRLLDVARRAGDLRVYKSGDLAFGVRSGLIGDGSATISFAGVASQALTNNAVNHIYLSAAGEVVVSTGGFPSPATAPHVPLATIATGSESAAGIGGQYDFADITDCRGGAVWQLSSALTAALANQAAAFFAAPEITRAVLRAQSAGAAPVEMTLDGSAPAAGNRYVLADARTCAIRLTVAARRSDGQSAMFMRQAIIRRVADTVDLVGAVQTVGVDINPAGWSVAVQADDTNKSLQVLVTGAAASDIRWAATVEAVEIEPN